jgi:hypothetical protein
MNDELRIWVRSVAQFGIIGTNIVGLILLIRMRRKVSAIRRSTPRFFLSPLKLVDPFKTAEFYLLLLTILIAAILGRVVFEWAA